MYIVCDIEEVHYDWRWYRFYPICIFYYLEDIKYRRGWGISTFVSAAIVHVVSSLLVHYISTSHTFLTTRQHHTLVRLFLCQCKVMTSFVENQRSSFRAHVTFAALDRKSLRTWENFRFMNQRIYFKTAFCVVSWHRYFI